MIDLDNYDPDSKEARARYARYEASRARTEQMARDDLIELAEELAIAFRRVGLVTMCGLTTAERARIRAALVAVNEHLVWAK